MDGLMTLEGTAVVTEVDGVYRLVEFQDYQGNVCYFHTDARVTWMADGTSVESFMRNSELTEAQINEIMSY